MPAALATILYILLFIVCLSVLIVVHELGHLSMAKVFKVYCFEFSIGFGPALIHKKRKDGETYFSLRAVPLGGYVSMFGEEVDLPDGTQVDPSRSLNAIKKWKRALIIVAGVTMNAVLAIVLFFITSVCMPQEKMYINQVQVKENSIAFNAGIKNEDIIFAGQIKDSNYVYYSIDGLVSYTDGTSQSVAPVMDSSKPTFNDYSFHSYLEFAPYNNQGVDLSSIVNPNDSRVASVNFTIQTLNIEKSSEEKLVYDDHKLTLITEADSLGNRHFVDSGLSLNYVKYWNDFGTGMSETFTKFGYASSTIFRALGSLFTSASAWQDIGGIIAVGVQTTNTLKNFGLSTFIYLWGMISVNLAIVNLLPFPGLDGWQLLVIAVEAIAHREIPSKVKNIISAVGVVILLIFMILIIVKDVIGLF